MLTMNAIRDVLAPLYGGRKPGYPAIRRAMANGMPFILDPVYGKPMFNPDDVVAWVTKGANKKQVTTP
jgi:hypothetical protein